MNLKIKESMEGLRPDPSLVEDTRAKMLEAAHFAARQETRSRRIRRTVAALSAAAAALVLFFGVGSAWRHMTVSTYYLDINPSFAIEADRTGQVNTVTGLNDEALALMDLSTLKGLSVSECVNAIISSAGDAGYFGSDTVSVVSLALAEDEPGAERMTECAAEVENGNDMIAVYTSRVDRGTVSRARSAGISPGKMALADMVTGLDPDADASDWTGAPVTEIFDRLETLTESPVTPEQEIAAERIGEVTRRRHENGLQPGDAPADAPQDDAPVSAPQNDAPTAAPQDNTPAPAVQNDAPTAAPQDNMPAPAVQNDAPEAAPQDGAPVSVPQNDAPQAAPQDATAGMTEELPQSLPASNGNNGWPSGPSGTPAISSDSTETAGGTESGPIQPEEAGSSGNTDAPVGQPSPETSSAPVMTPAEDSLTPAADIAAGPLASGSSFPEVPDTVTEAQPGHSAALVLHASVSSPEPAEVNVPSGTSAESAEVNVPSGASPGPAEVNVPSETSAGPAQMNAPSGTSAEIPAGDTPSPDTPVRPEDNPWEEDTREEAPEAPKAPSGENAMPPEGDPSRQGQDADSGGFGRQGTVENAPSAPGGQNGSQGTPPGPAAGPGT